MKNCLQKHLWTVQARVVRDPGNVQLLFLTERFVGPVLHVTRLDCCWSRGLAKHDRCLTVTQPFLADPQCRALSTAELTQVSHRKPINSRLRLDSPRVFLQVVLQKRSCCRSRANFSTTRTFDAAISRVLNIFSIGLKILKALGPNFQNLQPD